MDVALPADLRKQVEQELASGRYRSRGELIEQAIRHFLEHRQRGQRRLDALRRIGQEVDHAGLYERWSPGLTSLNSLPGGCMSSFRHANASAGKPGTAHSR